MAQQVNSPDLIRTKLLELQYLQKQLINVERRVYVPHENGPDGGQLTVHKSTAHINALFTGNRFGKSRCIAQEFNWIALGKHPYRPVKAPPVRLRIVAEGFDYGVEQVILPLLRDFVIDHSDLKGGSWETGYHNASHTITYECGSTIQLMSYKLRDLGRGVQIFGGVDLDAVWHDESSPKDIWDENLARLVRYNGQAYCTLTPVMGMTWEYEEIYEPWELGTNDDILVVRGTMLDNPTVNPDAVARFRRSITDKRMDEIRFGGKWLPIAGRVYSEYKTDVHFVPYDAARIEKATKYVIIDPAPSKATAILWCGVDAEGSFAYQEMRLAETIPTICNEIRIRSEGHQIQQFIIDPTWAWTNNQFGISIHDEYRNNGIPVSPGSKDKWGRIEQLRKHLVADAISQKPSFVVFDTCPRLDWEFRHKQFKTSRAVQEGSYRPETLDRDDDLLTCAEYFVMANPIDLSSEGTGRYFIANAGVPMGLRGKHIRWDW